MTTQRHRTVVVLRRTSEGMTKTLQQLHPERRRACTQLRVLAEVIPGPAVWFVAEGTERDDLGREEEA